MRCQSQLDFPYMSQARGALKQTVCQWNLKTTESGLQYLPAQDYAKAEIVQIASQTLAAPSSVP